MKQNSIRVAHPKKTHTQNKQSQKSINFDIFTHYQVRNEI